MGISGDAEGVHPLYASASDLIPSRAGRLIRRILPLTRQKRSMPITELSDAQPMISSDAKDVVSQNRSSFEL